LSVEVVFSLGLGLGLDERGSHTGSHAEARGLGFRVRVRNNLLQTSLPLPRRDLVLRHCQPGGPFRLAQCAIFRTSCAIFRTYHAIFRTTYAICSKEWALLQGCQHGGASRSILILANHIQEIALIVREELQKVKRSTQRSTLSVDQCAWGGGEPGRTRRRRRRHRSRGPPGGLIVS
jgi:hypothetical protein